MSARRLVLASTSPYRRELLDRLRVPYEPQAHRVDERTHVPHGALEHGASVADLARNLALAKAESLRAACPDAWIIGSDQLVELDGQLLGKPGTAAAAEAQLAAMAGRTHRLVTGVALSAPDGSAKSAVSVYRMKMRALDAGEIARYVSADRPLDCAGSYKIESLGIALFDALEGPDFTAIMGLPLLTVAEFLRRAGFVVP